MQCTIWTINIIKCLAAPHLVISNCMYQFWFWHLPWTFPNVTNFSGFSHPIMWKMVTVFFCCNMLSLCLKFFQNIYITYFGIFSTFQWNQTCKASRDFFASLLFVQDLSHIELGSKYLAIISFLNQMSRALLPQCCSILLFISVIHVPSHAIHVFWRLIYFYPPLINTIDFNLHLHNICCFDISIISFFLLLHLCTEQWPWCSHHLANTSDFITAFVVQNSFLKYHCKICHSLDEIQLFAPVLILRFTVATETSFLSQEQV